MPERLLVSLPGQSLLDERQFAFGLLSSLSHASIVLRDSEAQSGTNIRRPNGLVQHRVRLRLKDIFYSRTFHLRRNKGDHGDVRTFAQGPCEAMTVHGANQVHS